MRQVLKLPVTDIENTCRYTCGYLQVYLQVFAETCRVLPRKSCFTKNRIHITECTLCNSDNIYMHQLTLTLTLTPSPPPHPLTPSPSPPPSPLPICADLHQACEQMRVAMHSFVCSTCREQQGARCRGSCHVFPLGCAEAKDLFCTAPCSHVM